MMCCQHRHTFFLQVVVFLLLTFRSTEARLGGQQIANNDATNSEIEDRESSSSASRHRELWRRLSDDGQRELNDDDEVKVIVGYKNTNGKALVEERMKGVAADLHMINAEAVTIQVSELRNLLEDPDILYADKDDDVKGAAEAIPYGIVESQNGPDTLQARAASFGASTGACSRSGAMRVAVLDSGATPHSDLPCSKSNCIGKDFTSGRGGGWNSPTNTHGTEVLGVISAIGNNAGIQGMAHQQDICYLIGKVLDGNNAGSMSTILDALQWAVDNKAKVINLSIDGAGYSMSANDAFDKVYNSGALVVAAAGNGGSNSYTYPAAYDSVISVAAVGETRQVAWFSQRNNKVDLSAPGTNILSTAIRNSQNTVGCISVFNEAYCGKFVKGSRTGSSTGTLVTCISGGRGKCPGNGGHICLMQEGNGGVQNDAQRCQDSGGRALVVYNAQADKSLDNRLGGSRNSVSIPVVQMTMTDGKELAKSVGRTASLTRQMGFSFADGTSLSAPHVTGAIATLWDSCPRCTNKNIESCLLSTARYLGTANSYGKGLLQTQSAYTCLRNTQRCC